MISQPASSTDNGAPDVAKPGEATRESFHRVLRRATRQDHVHLDQAMSRFDLAEPAGYGRFLTIHLCALQSLASRWRAQDRPDFMEMLRCLVSDLKSLDIATERGAPDGAGATSLRSWGVSYVIHGSRLGGAILRGRVPAGFPTAYLAFVPGLAWPQFLSQLEHEAQSNSATALRQITRGARLAFAAFATVVDRADAHQPV